jgi:hypothetical protein
MNEELKQILIQFREYLDARQGKAEIDFGEFYKAVGIPREKILRLVRDEEELVEKALEFERNNFEEIFKIHDFDGVNAIDVLMTVSKEVARKFKYISPAVTFSLRTKYPEVYQRHFNSRRDFIYENIKLNLTKGIKQGMYRDDLSIELIARLYLSRLIDIHNPDFFPPDQFSFEVLFNTMFDNFVRSIAKPEGLAHFDMLNRQQQF